MEKPLNLALKTFIFSDHTIKKLQIGQKIIISNCLKKYCVYNAIKIMARLAKKTVDKVNSLMKRKKIFLPGMSQQNASP